MCIGVFKDKYCKLFTSVIIVLSILGIILPIDYHNNIQPEYMLCNITKVTNDVTDSIAILGYTINAYINEEYYTVDSRYWLNIFSIR